MTDISKLFWAIIARCIRIVNAKDKYERLLQRAVYLLFFFVIVAIRNVASADQAITPISPSATPSTTLTAQGTQVTLFTTPPPVRTEEPLTGSNRNFPSVFPDIKNYYKVPATLERQDLLPPPAIGLAEAALAVVQISSCDQSYCNKSGSGVLVHQRGLILTAYHVLLTDAEDPTSSHYQNFIIALTTNPRNAPQARYMARLVAQKADQDLALLMIDRDLTGKALALDEINLPALPIADITNLFGEELPILGYPVDGAEAINTVSANFSSFDDNGRLIVLDRALSAGNSGGPALVKQAGRFAIAGIVIRLRSTQGQSSREGLLRAIDQLDAMTWASKMTRAWVEPVQAKVQTSNQGDLLRFVLNLNTLDLRAQPLRLLFYATLADNDQPWKPNNANAPLLIWADVAPQHVIEHQALTITVQVSSLGTTPNRLRFRTLLWDTNNGNSLWVDTKGVQAALAVETLAPTAILTSTPLISTEKSLRTVQVTVTPTLMPSPISVITPVQQATATPLPVATNTPSPTAFSTPTLNTAATASADATNTALLQKAVAATLTASMPTPTPTHPLVNVKVPSLNVRNGPGTNYPIIGSVAQNAQLIVIGQAYNCAWLQVYYDDAKRGWISSSGQYVTFEGTCANIPVVTLPPTPAPFRLNIRNLKSTYEYRVIYKEKSTGLAVKQPIYTDRDYVYLEVPEALQGATYILTPNKDKFSNQSVGLIEMTSNKSIQVYVAYSDGFSNRASWLQTYQDTGLDLKFIDNESRVVTLSLYTKVFAANSNIVLGGNTPDGSLNSSMYTIVVKVLE